MSIRQIPYLQNMFSRFKDVTCFFSPQSITMYKNQELYYWVYCINHRVLSNQYVFFFCNLKDQKVLPSSPLTCRKSSVSILSKKFFNFLWIIFQKYSYKRNRLKIKFWEFLPSDTSYEKLSKIFNQKNSLLSIIRN